MGGFTIEKQSHISKNIYSKKTQFLGFVYIYSVDTTNGTTDKNTIHRNVLGG